MHSPVDHLRQPHRPAQLGRLGHRPDRCDGVEPADAVDFWRSAFSDGADEVVELNRDYRGIDVGERQVVLGALGAEELGGDTIELEAAELSSLPLSSLSPSATTTAFPLRSCGTLIEPSRPWMLRWIQSRPGPDGMYDSWIKTPDAAW